MASSVFAQGVDIPSLKSVVNAAAGASVIQTLQRLGRGTRVTADKTEFEAWDVLDTGNRYLAKHGKQRLETYQREGYKVEVVAAKDLGVTVVDPRKDFERLGLRPMKSSVNTREDFSTLLNERLRRTNRRVSVCITNLLLCRGYNTLSGGCQPAKQFHKNA